MSDTVAAVTALVEYAQTRLPQQPRLVPWITQVDLGDDRLQFRAGDLAVTLRHPLLIAAFRASEPLLDGTHTLEEITDAAPDVGPPLILFMLKMLRAQGLLQEGVIPSPLTPAELVRWDRQLRFLSHFVPDVLPIHVTLRQAKVAVLGAPALTAAIHQALTSLGVGEVRVLPPTDGALPWTAEAVNHIDLLIACQESASYAFFDAVNLACLTQGLPWMRVAVEATTGLLGPTIIPRQTACYTCYDLRWRSNAPDLEGFLAYRATTAQQSSPPDGGMIEPLWMALAGQVGMEVARLLTGFAPPITIGRFYELSARAPGAPGHEVLRIPRCPSCGATTVVRELWDLAFESTDLVI